MRAPARLLSRERMLWKPVCHGWHGLEKPLREVEHLMTGMVVLRGH